MHFVSGTHIDFENNADDLQNCPVDFQNYPDDFQSLEGGQRAGVMGRGREGVNLFLKGIVGSAGNSLRPEARGLGGFRFEKSAKWHQGNDISYDSNITVWS